MGSLKDLVGSKFGTLMVIRRSIDKIYHYGETKVIKITYECQCNCGKIVSKSAEYLRNKKTPSCSTVCRRTTLPDLIGEKINQLTVIKGPFSKNKEGRLYWSCLCDCGIITDINNSRLSKKVAIACRDCVSTSIIKKFNSEKRIPYNKMMPGEAAFNDLYRRYQKSADKKQITFLLSKEDFRKITKENCTYCGSFPKNCHPSKESEHKLNEKGKRTNGFYTYNGVDRVNSSKGYEGSNCVSCCANCNYIKNDWDLEELKLHLSKMIQKLNIG